MKPNSLVALVKEASRRIGRAIGIDLAKEWISVVVSYRSRLDSTAEVANKRLVAITDWGKPKEMK